MKAITKKLLMISLMVVIFFGFPIGGCSLMGWACSGKHFTRGQWSASGFYPAGGRGWPTNGPTDEGAIAGSFTGLILGVFIAIPLLMSMAGYLDDKSRPD